MPWWYCVIRYWCVVGVVDVVVCLFCAAQMRISSYRQSSSSKAYGVARAHRRAMVTHIGRTRKTLLGAHIDASWQGGDVKRRLQNKTTAGKGKTGASYRRSILAVKGICRTTIIVWQAAYGAKRRRRHIWRGIVLAAAGIAVGSNIRLPISSPATSLPCTRCTRTYRRAAHKTFIHTYTRRRAKDKPRAPRASRAIAATAACLAAQNIVIRA